MCKNKENKPKWQENLEGIFGGVSEIINKLSDVAEKGKSISETGNITDKSDKIKGIFGVSVNFGINGSKPDIKPFGNIHKDEKSGESTVQEVREPLVDIFDEDEYILIVAELPGISNKDVKIEIEDDILIFNAKRGEKKYQKEILLSESFTKSQIKTSCNNGVLEIKCFK